MSEERIRVLQLLSDGKITVEEAERLLDALGDGTPRGAAGAPSGTGASSAGMEEEIRAHLDQTRRTIRASMPRLKQRLKETMPDVDQVIKEATDSLPDVGQMLKDMTISLSGAFSDWQRSGSGEGEFLERAERDRQQSFPLTPGTWLLLHNRRGHVQVETWEREELEVRLHIEVQATSSATAQEYADRVGLDLTEEGEDRVRLLPILPEREEGSGVGTCRLDFVLRVPANVDLGLQTAHGNLELPALEGSAILANQHGSTRLESATGKVSVQQSHGPARIGPVGKDLKLEGRHGAMEVESVQGEAVVAVRHGPLSLGRVGKNAELDVSHFEKLEVKGVGGDVTMTLSHGDAVVRDVGGRLVVQARHAPVEIERVRGPVQATNSHAPLILRELGGDLVARNSHGPIHVEGVAGEALVKNGIGPVRLRRISGDTTVQGDRGPIQLEEVAGRVAVQCNRAPVHIQSPGSEVVVHNDRGPIEVRPQGPIAAAYTLRADRGHVDLLVPPGSDLEVQGHVTRGKVETDLPLEVAANNQQGYTVSGRLGDGGPALKVEVARGNLYLRAGDSGP